jgi:hypothetical protein
MTKTMLASLIILGISGCMNQQDEIKSSGMKCGAGKCGANMFDGNSALEKKKKNILNQMDSEDTRKACVIDAPTSKEIYNCVRDSESGKLTKSYKNKASKETLESSKVPSMKCGVGRCGGSM